MSDKIDSSDPKLIALAHFKDWSNYLLVVTVAAVGWTAETKDGNQVLMDLAVWALSLSLVFGILALALVPLVAEQMQPSHKSIYDVQAKFRMIWGLRFYIPQACRPQHILFMVGAILYCLASTEPGWAKPIEEFRRTFTRIDRCIETVGSVLTADGPST